QYLLPRSPYTPTSPSFPYTTLFRSPHHHRRRQGRRPVEGRADDRRDDRIAGIEPAESRRRGPRFRRCVPAASLDELGIGRRSHRDRKSTRLNSSHVSISYAVFCLKK